MRGAGLGETRFPVGERKSVEVMSLRCRDDANDDDSKDTLMFTTATQFPVLNVNAFA